MVVDYHSFLVQFYLFGTMLYPSNLTAIHYLGRELREALEGSISPGPGSKRDAYAHLPFPHFLRQATF